MANAAVLPVPVCAHPSMSRPFNNIGIDCACIGVGVPYPASFSALKRGSINLSCLKFIGGEGRSNVLKQNCSFFGFTPEGEKSTCFKG